MEETLKYIVDEAIAGSEQNGDFVIDTDEKAEWALKKIALEKAELARMSEVCYRMIETYQKKIEEAEARYENKTNYLKGMLQRYMSTVQTKDSKTQKTYALPSGKLKIKYQAPEYVRDDDKVVDYLLQHRLNDLINTKITPKWGDFKKRLAVTGETVIDKETGEIVDGIIAVEREPVFDVEVE